MCGRRSLWVGDGLALLGVTIAGFFVHGTQAHLGRMALTAVLSVLSWYLAAWPLGLLEPATASRPRQWLYVLWAGILATPLALALRGWILMQPLAPLFAPAATAFNLLGLGLWRGLWWLACRTSAATR